MCCFPKCSQTYSNSLRFSFYEENHSDCWHEIVSFYMGKYGGGVRNLLFINFDEFCRRKQNQKSIEILKTQQLIIFYHYLSLRVVMIPTLTKKLQILVQKIDFSKFYIFEKNKKSIFPFILCQIKLKFRTNNPVIGPNVVFKKVIIQIS